MAIEVTGLRALDTNYIWILRDETKSLTLVVDPSEASTVQTFLKKKQWNLDAILITHHHHDHVGGNLDLVKSYGCPVFGWQGDQSRIPGLSHPLNEGRGFNFKGLKAEVIYIPAHTLGHIAFYFSNEKIVFVGDTLFGMGCGRMFEGNAQQLFDSLGKLKSLPPETRVYCGHEYTMNNAKFSEEWMEHRSEFQKRFKIIKKRDAEGLPTVPFTIEEELQTNPFLNTDDSKLKMKLGKPDATDIEILADLRQRKDQF